MALQNMEPASPVPGQGHFISLKWRALLLTSIVLVVMIFGGAWLNYDNLSRQLRTQLAQDNAARLRELHALMGQSVERLRQLAGMIPTFPGMQTALRGNDGLAVASVLDAQWPALQFDLGLDRLVVYGSDDASALAQWSVSSGTEVEARLVGLVAMARAQETPQSLLECSPECMHYVAAPMLAEGRNAGVVLLGVGLADTLRSFAAVSGAEVGLLRIGARGSRDPALGRLDAWNADLSALTRPEQSLPVLRLAAGRQALEDAAGGLLVEAGERSYDLRVSTLPGLARDHPIRLLVIADITAPLSDIRAAAQTAFGIGAIGWLLAECALLAILWRPMSRLRKTAQTLPLLAQSEFATVRATLAGILLPKGRGWRFGHDEIDWLDAITIALADRLEILEAVVRERTEGLARQRDELAAERDFVNSLLDTAQVAILTLDAQLRIVRANSFASAISGAAREELGGQPFLQLLAPESAGELTMALRGLLAGNEHLRHESLVVHRNGTLRTLTWHHSRLGRSVDGGGPLIVSVGLDNTERRGAEMRLAWLADHDQLTGLPNRPRLQEELELMIAAAARQNRSGALLMVDLDQFRYINEADTHQSGDRLLKAVAVALQRGLPEADFIARLGGDEFAVLLRETDAERACRIGADINQQIANIRCEVAGRPFRLSASIGIVLFPGQGGAEEVLAHGDFAMYQAKEAGRGHWHLFSEADRARERLQDRMLWKDRVASALDEDRIELYFQPIMHIGEGTISHHEVLVRLRDPDGRIHAAGQFIEAAERTGMINALDRRVLTKAIRHLAAITRSGHDASFALNLSGHTLGDPELLALLRRALDEHDVDPARLIFEITETAAVADFEQALAVIVAIKSLGCRFALDDFGIGFSSFTYLRHFPVDYLKLDGSFIRQLPDRPEDQAIVRALHQIAIGFGKRTIAEYVETEATLKLLGEIGIDYAQGYYISEPRPLEVVFGISGPQPESA